MNRPTIHFAYGAALALAIAGPCLSLSRAHAAETAAAVAAPSTPSGNVAVSTGALTEQPAPRLRAMTAGRMKPGDTLLITGRGVENTGAARLAQSGPPRAGRWNDGSDCLPY